MIEAPQSDLLRPAGSFEGGNGPVNVDAMLKAVLGRGSECYGMAAAVLRGERIIARGAAGVRVRGTAERITFDDRFLLASCTKAMTATLVAMLVEEGKLNWTTTLGELFAETMKPMHPAWEKVTVRQVLAHRAGLRLDPDGFARVLNMLLFAPYISWRSGSESMRSSEGTVPEQRLKIVREALSRRPGIAPDTKYWYSNVGYILAGAAVEQLTGCAWEDVMRERLFEPLGISTGGFRRPGTAGKTDQPWGHSSIVGKPIDPGSRAAQFPALYYGPAGTAHMTITDWARFIGVHLRGDPANPQGRAVLLKPETFSELHAVTAGTPYSKGWVMRGITRLATGEAGPAVTYRAGWFVGTSGWANGYRHGDTGRYFWHGGSDGMSHCVVCVAPEIDFAVLVACNRGLDIAIWKTRQAVRALIGSFAPKGIP